MKKKYIKWFSFFLLIMSLTVAAQDRTGTSKIAKENPVIKAAAGVLQRVIGDKARQINLELIKSSTGLDTFEVVCNKGILTVRGNSSVALCYGFNTYLKNYCHIMFTWNTRKLNMPLRWVDCPPLQGASPYQYRYYMNVVTFGYTTPYWDWKRWEKELDWMSMHGMNMPLALISSEAIARRVWLKLGLTEKEIGDFFSGPAYFPWHRMGNLNKWDGPFPISWHQDQLALQHKLLNRMHELGMHPVAPAFAGFVPEGFQKRYPDEKVNSLKWGGFETEYNAHVLMPGSTWFAKLGKMFIEEWEKEFGKNDLYLSDSFNEMDVPVAKDDTTKRYKLLADYGETIYNSIKAGNPNAVWVTQGWTFGNKNAFWDKASVKALLSKVPDDKMLILDLANEYPKHRWKIDPVWQTQEGFYGKKWVFSYVPNFGGKIPYTADLPLYASASANALHSAYAKNLVGFGFAPEGIENNEIVYELLADMGWTRNGIDLEKWTDDFCKARYGGYPAKMKIAQQDFLQTCFSDVTSYPKFVWQMVEYDKKGKTRINTDKKFLAGVENFLDCSDQLKQSELYRADAIEATMLYLGIKADDLYKQALHADSVGDVATKIRAGEKAILLLKQIDTLLESHPVLRLNPWINYARNHGQTTKDKDYYESNAKRLITTWGGNGSLSEYAARLWSGLIRDYYIPRVQQRLAGVSTTERLLWEEKWIKTPGISQTKPYADPLQKAKELVAQFRVVEK